MARGLFFLWSLVAFAAGILAGFLLAAIVTPGAAQQTEERQSLLGRIESLEQQSEVLQSRLKAGSDAYQSLEASMAEERKKTGDTEKKRADVERTGKEFALRWLKSQAFIGILGKLPSARAALLSDGFRRAFKSDWFVPDEAAAASGSQWLLDELKERGLADEQASVPAVPLPPVWVSVGKWHLNGPRTTEAFQITGRVWRIRWNATDNYAVSVRIFNRATGEEVAPASFEGSSLLCLESGTFYLEAHCPYPADLWVERIAR